MTEIHLLHFGGRCRLLFTLTGLLFTYAVSPQIVLDPLPVSKPSPRSYLYSAPTLRNLTATVNAPSRRRPADTVRGRARRNLDYFDNSAEDEDDEQDQTTSRNVTDLLNSLFLHYNKTFRPGYGFGPTHVATSMVVLTLGPISELNSDYSMDCYFRQYWRDERLKFTSSDSLKEIALNNLMLDMIWKPDTYFHNGKEYYVHTLTTANKLLRLSPNGDVTYSMRFTIRAQCPMKLTFYPADAQSCPLIIGSFAYQSHDLLYHWHKEGVKKENGLTMPQFELVSHPFRNFFAEFEVGFKRENYSMVRVDFQLQRRMGYFLLQIYLPCMLIVVLSWVSFWLNREATERLTLGITAFLTLATTNQDQKDILPKTSFPTALEWYILICNFYVSASIIQFAAVHFFTKTGFEEINLPPETSTDTEDDWENVYSSEHDQTYGKMANSNHKFSNHIGAGVGGKYPNDKVANHTGSNHRDVRFKVRDDVEDYSSRAGKESGCQKFIYCITGNEEYRTELIKRGKHRGSSINSVSTLDRMSRILFPLSFGVVNVFYWTSFLYAGPAKTTVVGI